MTRVLKVMELLPLLFVCFASLLILLIDLFGFSDNTAFFKNLNYSYVAVLILSVIGINVAINGWRSNKVSELLKLDADHIIKSLNGVEIKTFSDGLELDLYLIKRIREAKVSVKDLSWKSSISSSYSTVPRLKAQKELEQTISRCSDHITYFEIFTLTSQKRKDKLARRIKENKRGYSAAFVEDVKEIPRLQFVIIDDDEVIFASSAYPTPCAIKQKELVELLCSYYDECWNASQKIMLNEEVVSDEILELIFGKKPYEYIDSVKQLSIK